jgi:plastocyanin
MNPLKRLIPAILGTILISMGLIGQTPTGPSIDRVGFPADYTKKMKVLYVYDRPDNKQVRTIYANDPVFEVSTATQNDYPYGSILVMETWRSMQDSQGIPILDANGRYQKDPAATPTLFVMRKEKGFGAEYGPVRNGEWEYVAYRPDGTYNTTPQASFSCATCHLQATQWKDWVFRAGLKFSGASGANPAAVMRDYTFVPGTLHIKPNSTVTFYNDDVIAHHIADDDTRGFSVAQDIRAGGSVALKFGPVPFTWTFHCAIHPGMRGTIVVDPQ